MKDYIRVDEVEKNLDFINLAITLKSVDGKNRQDMIKVCSDAGFNIENLTSNIQIHSDIVNVIDENNVSQKKEGDALVTNLSGVPILMFTADCVPIIFIDKKNKAIGLAHAGWRGTYEKIAKKTIDTMNDKYNTNKEDLMCIIGPSIGPCCYEVSQELAQKFHEKFTNNKEKFYIIKDEKYYLDLWKINEYILKSSGVENIINLNLCTSCNEDKFHSYRKHNKSSERIATILQIK